MTDASLLTTLYLILSGRQVHIKIHIDILNLDTVKTSI